MAQLSRQAKGFETLDLQKCPCCGGEVLVGDCGYTSFNPGWAQCNKCKRKWSFESVEDSWDAGEQWNALAVKIKHKLKVLSWLGVKASTSIISRDFAAEKLQEEAAKLLKEFEAIVIGAENPKSR
jgi:hypothetical protein